MKKEDFNKLFGEFVRGKREQKSWTQPDLASKLGNNFQNISRMERGEINPSMFWTNALAAAFEVPLSEMMKEFENFVAQKQKEPSRTAH